MLVKAMGHSLAGDGRVPRCPSSAIPARPSPKPGRLDRGLSAAKGGADVGVAPRPGRVHQLAQEPGGGTAMDGLRNSEYRHIEVSRIAGSLGAEVTGVDLAQDLPDDVLGEIRHALLAHCVIFFCDQHLTPETQLAFARRW